MEKITDSDMTMVATYTFNHILHTIQSSELNYYLQMSPYSATISLKKTIAKDKTGAPIKASYAFNEPRLENELYSLRKKHEEMLKDYDEAKNKIAVLQDEIIDRENAYNELSAQYEIARNTTSMLNKVINENRVKFEEEKLTLFKEYKSDVNLWEKDLGNTNRRHIKLEKKNYVL